MHRFGITGLELRQRVQLPRMPRPCRLCVCWFADREGAISSKPICAITAMQTERYPSEGRHHSRQSGTLLGVIDNYRTLW